MLHCVPFIQSIYSIAVQLWTWTPYLAAGFVWNIVISVSATALGTVLGYVLALARLSPRRAIGKAGAGLTMFTRNAPTFVLQFYLVFMLPSALPLPFIGVTLPLPPWLKATLALALSVAGFVSDNALRAIRARRDGSHREMTLFMLHWGNFFVIVVMASSAASVIGVPELVSRCNSAVAMTGRTNMMLWTYLYAMSWFFLFCFAATTLIGRFSRRLDRQIRAECDGRLAEANANAGNSPGHREGSVVDVNI